MNRRTRLTDALVRRLKPAGREYTVRDSTVPSLGVRVHASGSGAYVHVADGRRVSLGPTVLKTVREARHESLALLANGIPDNRASPMFHDFAVGPWRDSWVDRVKPATVRERDWMLGKRLLPAFGTLRLDRITAAAAQRWFDDFSRTAPGNANHGLQILRQIFNHAIACGRLASNPAAGVKLNPKKKITRFLSREELDRLHRVLDGRERSSRLPQRRDCPSAPGRGDRQQAPAPDEQDGTQNRLSERRGPFHYRQEVARQQRVSLSIAA